MIYSETEYSLRTMVDRVTAALVQETPVVVIPSDAWESDPVAQPPVLRYRVADVAVLGDALLDVTATEIAHVLFTREADWTFETRANPEAAQLLFDEVEKARVQRRMGNLYAGTRQVFERFGGEQKPHGAWSNPQVKKDFMKLPVKWRYILNVNRSLRGMSLVGDGFEIEYLREVADDLELAANATYTQQMMDYLERPFVRLADAIARESEMAEYQEYCHKCALDQAPPMSQQEWEDAGKPEEPPKPDPGASDSVSDFEHPPAKEDDGEPGGTDGSPGMRQHGQGLSGPDEGAGSEDSESPQGGDGDGDAEDSATPYPESVSDAPSDTDLGSEGESSSQERDPSGPEVAPGPDRDDFDDEPQTRQEAKVKTGNVFRAMVEDLGEGEGGQAVKNFKNYFKKVDREAAKVERQISNEAEDHMHRMAEGLGNRSGRRTERVRHMVDRGDETIRQILPELDPLIRALRQHARSVLRENSVDAWGGNYRAGRKIKHNKLHRIRTEEEPRIFERRTVLGGKSYCIGIASDQSSSMALGGKILLAGMCTVSALEAFDGLIETAATGFFSTNGHFGPIAKVHYYKRIDEPVVRIEPLLGQLFTSSGMTPMGEGLLGVLDEVKRSAAQVKTVILVSDGKPTMGETEPAFEEAARSKVPIDALAIGSEAQEFFETHCRHMVPVTDPLDIVPGYVSLLRRIIRRESAVA